jgi:hypothetical protein
MTWRGGGAMHTMAPLSRLSALQEETRQALTGLQLRSGARRGCLTLSFTR